MELQIVFQWLSPAPLISEGLYWQLAAMMEGLQSGISLPEEQQRLLVHMCIQSALYGTVNHSLNDFSVTKSFKSFSWSRSGHTILSASTDNTVAIWEVLTGECNQRYRFPSPIIKVQFHPRKADTFLVCPMRHAAVLVELEGNHKLLPLDEDEVLS